jgi:small-conductance mechanosensitive channel
LRGCCDGGGEAGSERPDAKMTISGGFHSHGLAIAFPPREVCKSITRQLVVKILLNICQRKRQTNQADLIH